VRLKETKLKCHAGEEERDRQLGVHYFYFYSFHSDDAAVGPNEDFEYHTLVNLREPCMVSK
jgi:hypothetical protein